MAEAVNTITIEQVKATVTDLLAQKDQEKAVATRPRSSRPKRTWPR
jgi:hypothetical protein